MKVIWTPLAEQQVADAFAYIAADRPDAALAWFERLVDRAESLSELPDQGHVVPEADRDQIREVFVDPYRLMYRRDDDQILVLTVQHQRQDFDPETVE